MDIETEMLAFGGEFHRDSAEVLVQEGSRTIDVWGINILFNVPKEDRLEFNSLINIKPELNHRSIEIENKKICDKIQTIVEKFIT